MFARVGTYDVPEGRAEAVKEAFREALAEIRRLPGFRDAMLLHACDDRRTVTITLWDDAASLTGSRVSASRLRAEAARAVDGEVMMVDEYELIELV